MIRSSTAGDITLPRSPRATLAPITITAFCWVLCAAPLTESVFAQQPEKPLGVLLIAGDIAYCGNDTSTHKAHATAELVEKEVTLASNAGIAVRILLLGDLAYPNGMGDEFKCFHAVWGAHKDLFLPVPGNHDYGDGRHFADPYFSYMEQEPALPIVNRNGPRKGYYALNFPDLTSGPWRLYGLNAYVRAIRRQQRRSKRRQMLSLSTTSLNGSWKI